jgi:Zn-dependent protease with chaperone function
VVAFSEADSGAVSFVHDPEAGARTWQRLHVAAASDALGARLHDLEARGRTPGAAGELRHLLELAVPPDEAVAVSAEAGPATAATATRAPAGPAAADPADRLAAWLLARTDLDGV